jgi:hypothetical protein
MLDLLVSDIKVDPMFSSRSERGFYDPEINASMPPDAVSITAEYHTELLAGQSAGRAIEWGDDGYPVLVDRQPPGPEEQAATERNWRDSQLALTDPLVSRHRDEVEEGGSTTLAAEQYIELQTYRRQLRDWPQGEQFPLAEHRPPAPPWLAEQPN